MKMVPPKQDELSPGYGQWFSFKELKYVFLCNRTLTQHLLEKKKKMHFTLST